MRAQLISAINTIKCAENAIALYKEAAADMQQANSDLFNVQACNYRASQSVGEFGSRILVSVWIYNES